MCRARGLERPQRLTELTITPAWQWSSNATVRLDLRVDRSNQLVFEARAGAKTTQPTAQVLNLVFLFLMRCRARAGLSARRTRSGVGRADSRCLPSTEARACLRCT